MKNIFATKLILNLHLNGTFINTNINTIIQITFLHFKNVIKNVNVYVHSSQQKKLLKTIGKTQKGTH
jgi:hypothetical protein